MHTSSDDILEQVRSREVTGVFHSRKALIDAAETAPTSMSVPRSTSCNGG